MRIAWQTKFKSFSGKQCRVDIYANDGSGGEIISLIPSDNPFWFEEEKSKDMQTRLRYRTGYIEVIEESYNALSALNVGGLYVEMFYDGTLYFTGYTQDNTGQMNRHGYPSVKRVPIISPLGYRKDTGMEAMVLLRSYTSYGTQVRLRDMFEMLLRELGGPRYQYIVTPGIDLTQYVNVTWFVWPNDEYYVGKKPAGAEAKLWRGKTVLEVLEGIGTLFDIVFHDTADALICTKIGYNGEYFAQLVNETSSSSYSHCDVFGNIETAVSQRFYYRSDKQKESLVKAIGSVREIYDFQNAQAVNYNIATVQYIYWGREKWEDPTTHTQVQYLVGVNGFNSFWSNYQQYQSGNYLASIDGTDDRFVIIHNVPAIEVYGRKAIVYLTLIGNIPVVPIGDDYHPGLVLKIEWSKLGFVFSNDERSQALRLCYSVKIGNDYYGDDGNIATGQDIYRTAYFYNPATPDDQRGIVHIMLPRSNVPFTGELVLTIYNDYAYETGGEWFADEQYYLAITDVSFSQKSSDFAKYLEIKALLDENKPLETFQMFNSRNSEKKIENTLLVDCLAANRCIRTASDTPPVKDYYYLSKTRKHTEGTYGITTPLHQWFPSSLQISSMCRALTSLYAWKWTQNDELDYRTLAFSFAARDDEFTLIQQQLIERTV